MVQPQLTPYCSLTGFGSTMHGGIKSLLFSMPYLQKQMSQEEGGYQLNNLIITTFRKKAFTAPLYHTTSESERIQARLKWKKIELFNEYNKIDFSPKVKEQEFVMVFDVPA